MYRQQALSRLLVLNEGPLSEVESDRNSGFKLDLRAHPTRFGLCAEVEAVERVTVGHIQHLELTLNIGRQLLLSGVGTVTDGLVKAALAILR